MHINKNALAGVLFLAIVMLVVIGGTLLFGQEKEPAISAQAIQKDLEKGEDLPLPAYDIPDMDATQAQYEKPFEALDFSGLSPGTLTKEEVTASVEELLTGLLRLDAQAVERVSPRSTGGEHNPFRVMLNAALSDAEIKAAFLNMSRFSGFEILEVVAGSSNAYTVTISATTPYMATLASALCADEHILYVQELTKLKASGAAQAIAAMDLSTVPLHTDVVTLTIFVEEDVPILYYPTSLAYGSRIPQYAFLWGAIEFQGTNNKDLLVRNSDGGATEVSEQEFAKDGKCDAFVRYLNTALGSIEKADMEIMSDLSLLGNSLGTQWVPEILYPQYQALFKKSATFEADTIARLKSFAFTAKYCINTEPQSGEQLYTTAITYSVTDQLTGRRVYHTKYFILIPGSSTLSESEAAQINRKLSEILEDALGGGMPTAKRRLQLMDISGGN